MIAGRDLVGMDRNGEYIHVSLMDKNLIPNVNESFNHERLRSCMLGLKFHCF